MALAHCWQSADGFPDSVRQALAASPHEALHGLEVLLAIPEHRVPLPGGKRASQSDLFVLAKSRDRGLVAIGVEGKVSEPFGRFVSEWLAAPKEDGSPGPSEGRVERLDYLCRELGVDPDAVSSLRYQLLHRTVSALVEARRFNAPRALMLVHSFSQSNDGFDDFRRFATTVGAASVEPGAVASAGDRSGIELYLGWATGEPAWLER